MGADAGAGAGADADADAGAGAGAETSAAGGLGEPQAKKSTAMREPNNAVTRIANTSHATQPGASQDRQRRQRRRGHFAWASTARQTRKMLPKQILRFVRNINEKAIAPDLTIFLRVRAEVAMARIETTRTQKETFEQLPLQKRVATAYDKLLESYRDGEVVVLDGEEEMSMVTSRIRGGLERLF